MGYPRNEKEIDNTESPSVGDEIELFVKQIYSLAETLPLSLIAIAVSYDGAHQKYRNFIKQYCEIESESDHRLIKVPTDYAGRYAKLQSRIEKLSHAREAIPRSFIVSLVSSYDAFLGSLIRNLFLMQPDSLSSSEKKLTFSELTEFGSIEDARNFVVEKEVETVLRKSHSEQFDWLENKFGVTLRKGLDVWPAFIEVTERRNLFVHNRGIVSNQYLDTCRKHGFIFEEEIPQVGQQLDASPSYFNAAFETLFEIGVKLANVLWRKVDPKGIECADNSLINVSYDLLAEERFGLACRILDFSTDTLKRHNSEQNRLIFVINQAQAYKWSGDETRVMSILSAEDWSTRSDDFQLAEAVLNDDFERADLIVRRIGKTGSVHKNQYREWPLFREYRKTKKFQDIFEDLFDEPLNLFSVESQGTDLFADEPEEDPFFKDIQSPHAVYFLDDEDPPLKNYPH